MKYCTRCVTPDTRPRLTFDDDGVCRACTWHDEKQTIIDWNERWNKLEALCDRFRGKGEYDVIVPCSGGKDGSYVAWMMKHELDMNPLCITVLPQIQTWLGYQNLKNFIDSGFYHETINIPEDRYREVARMGFKEQGRPKLPFVTGISTTVLNKAVEYNIPFIMYGEEGEAEYGGAQDAKEKIDREYLIKYYYSGFDPKKYGDLWTLPEQKDLDKLYPTHWSKFEDWDPEHHAVIAKTKCNMQMMVSGSIGTFTNYSQLDDVMQDLHAYLMFVKFGFGRCTSDTSIEIRRGRLNREEGVGLVNLLDGQFPVEYLDYYLDYFGMDEKEFWGVIDKFARKDILKKTNMPERPYMLKRGCV